MGSLDFIPASGYALLFYNLVLLLTFFKCVQLSRPNYKLFGLLVLFLIVLIGLRPISGHYFGDTGNYAAYYRHIQNGGLVALRGEWVFNGLIFKNDTKEDAGELVKNDRPAARRRKDA